MAITQIFALSGIALGSIFLLLTRRRSRLRRSSIDSEYQQTLDRRLQELREECLDPSTLRQVAGEIRLILDRGSEPLCLPHPFRIPEPIDHEA